MARFADTQRLARADFEPAVSPRRGRSSAVLAIALVALLLAAFFAARSERGAPARIGELERENAALAARLDKTQLELDVEHATRAELEGQINALNAEVLEFRRQLGFINSREAGRPSPPRN